MSIFIYAGAVLTLVVGGVLAYRHYKPEIETGITDVEATYKSDVAKVKAVFEKSPAAPVAAPVAGVSFGLLKVAPAELTTAPAPVTPPVPAEPVTSTQTAVTEAAVPAAPSPVSTSAPAVK